jgi:hypothetical protein
MQRKILFAVTVMVCLGLCLGGLAAKNKAAPIQIDLDRADVIAGLASRDNVQVQAKAELLVEMARTLMAEGQTDQAVDLLNRVLLMDLPATRAGQKVLVNSYLALGDIYSQLPAEGLHKSIHFYGIALENMDSTEDADRMVSTLNTVSGIQTVLGDDAVSLAPLPLPNSPVALDTGDDDCGAAVVATLPWSEIMTVAFNGDHNWRMFTLAETSEVTIETISSDTFGDDTDLNLYGGCSGTVPTDFIAFNDDGGAGFLSLIELTLPAGDYWVEVGGYRDSRTPDDFELSITAFVPFLGPADEYEPDNESSVATSIGFRNNGVGQGNQGGRDNSQIQSHNIFPEFDIDFFTFGLSRANFVRMETTTDGDTVMGLSNASGNLFAVDDDGGVGMASKLEMCLPSDDWLIAVIGVSTFPYDMAVDVEYPCLFEDEPNATCDLTGDEIMPGEVWSGLQTPAGVAENDYYYFTLEEEAAITIETDGFDTFDVDTFLELYDGCPGNLIAADDDAGPGFLSKIDAVLPAGTYYVNVTVSPFAVGSYYPYSFSLTVAEPPMTETEPNDDCSLANPTVPGDTFAASIAPIGDYDAWMLSVPADGFIRIETDGPTGDTVLAVRNADGSIPVGCDDDSGNGLFSAWECCLPAGDYCVVVKEYGSNGTIANYEIGFSDLGSCTPTGVCPFSSSFQCDPF